MAHLGPNDYRDLHTPARQQTEGVLDQMSELGERAQTLGEDLISVVKAVQGPRGGGRA